MDVEVLDLNSHKDVVLQLWDLAVSDFEVADEALLLLELSGVTLKKANVEIILYY